MKSKDNNIPDDNKNYKLETLGEVLQKLNSDLI